MRLDPGAGTDWPRPDKQEIYQDGGDFRAGRIAIPGQSFPQVTATGRRWKRCFYPVKSYTEHRRHESGNIRSYRMSPGHGSGDGLQMVWRAYPSDSGDEAAGVCGEDKKSSR